MLKLVIFLVVWMLILSTPKSMGLVTCNVENL